MRNLKRLLGVPETDLSNILSGFNRVLDDLDAHIQHHQKSAEAKDEMARRLLAESNQHSVAVTNASNVRGKISALVS